MAAESEERTVASADRTRIAFTRTGSGPPLVAVHGTAADRTRWATVAPRLAAHFTVYAVDRRGRGASGDALEYALEREVDDVVSVVAAIGEPLTLLGHSYGGICALEAAARADNVRRLILYEPPIPMGVEIYPPGVVDRLQEFLDAGDRDALLSTFLAEVVRVPADQLALMRGRPAWRARLAAAHTIVREVRADRDYVFARERWRRLDTPTLLLLGRDSPAFFTDATKALHASLPRATLSVMPGQQHAAMDTAPEMFVAEILGFAAAAEPPVS